MINTVENAAKGGEAISQRVAQVFTLPLEARAGGEVPGPIRVSVITEREDVV